MLFILNRDYQVMGVADNTSEGALHYFNDKLTTDLTAGVSTFEFDVYKTNPTSAFLQEGNYITLKDTHGKQLLFTIMEMEEDSTKKSIYCEDVGLDLLNETVPPLKSATAQPISWYIQQSTNDSGWQIGTNQVSHLKRTLEYEGYSNALQRILSICNSFDGVEVDFTVEFKGNAVTKQLINIYRKRGKDSGLRYNAGIDLAEARRTVSLNDLATALRGVGSEITNKNNEVIGNTTFTNIVYDDGRYFTTKGSPFVFDREANKRWSRYRNMQSATQGYIVDYFSYDTKSEQELFNRALSQLKKRSEPAVEYEIEISKIKDNLMVGDTIEIVDNYFQPALHLQARVLAVTTSETVDSDNKLKLGNYKIIQSSIDEKLLALQAKLNSIKLSWSENNAPVLVVKSTNGEAFFNNYIDTNLNASIIRGGIDITNSYTSDEVVWSKRDRFGVNVSGWNRTGFSIPLSIEDINTKNTFVATVDGMEAQITIFNTLTTVESPTAPTEPQQGQIWLDTSVQPPIQKVYLGGKWKHVTPITEEQFEDVKAISELASSGVESLNGELATVKDNVAGKVDSTTYTQKVSAIESALANKVEQSIQQADKLALEGEIAKKVAQTAYDTKVSELNTAISGKVGTATYNANKALQDAEIAKKVAQTAYDTKVAELNTAIGKKLDTSVANETKLLQDAEIAKKVAQEAYDTKVAELNTAIGKKLDTSVANANKVAQDAEIAKKVAQTTYNTKMNALDTAISGHTTRIEATETGLLAKASVTDVNALKTRMSTAETSLTTNASAIALKASQEDLDTIEGRLETTEAELVVQAGEIASKVAKTDFNNLSGRVGTAESTIIQHASEIASRVKQTDFDSLSGRVGTAESSITQQAGEIASKVATTTYNAGIATKENAITKANTAPSHANGKLWLNTSVTPNVLNRSNGTTWIKVTPTTAKEVGAFSSSDGSALTTRVSTAESSITQQAGVIALKASQEDLDTVSGRVTTAEGTLSVQAGLIASKASQSDFDAVKGRVASAESSITQQASQISLKASQSDLDAIDGRMDSAESELSVQAGLIASKVAQSEFDAVENRLDSAESTITQQAGLIASKVATTTYNTGIASKENTITKANTAPAHSSGKLWLDTSVTPNILKRSTGTAWVKATPTTASEVGAYSSSAGSALAGRVSTAESSITQQAGLIASKVAQTDFNALSSRVGTAESTITQQASQISLKASQSDLNALDGRLDTAEAEIVVQSGQIASKVSQSEFDAVEDRLGTAESSITQQAGEIASKVATTTYNAGIASKENAVIKSNTAPTHANGKLWLNTSVTPNVLNRSTGTAWVKATPTTASEVGAYSSSAGSALAGRVTTAESTIVQQAGLIASKVSQTDFDGVNGRLGTAESSITQQAGEIALKASQEDLDTIEGRVETSETKIATNASQIALKASTSALNATNGRLTTAEGKITVNAQNIASKVSQTEFDAVEGRLDTAESTITQQAGLIESKVAQTTYDTDINNATTGLKKKMSNAESRITQTEKDITSKVSQTTYDADINNATTGLKKRISTAESSITQQAGEIASKVATTTYTTGLATKANASDVYKKSEVDTKVNAKADASTVTALTTRVTNSETAITQANTAINLRATKTEAQGYATQATKNAGRWVSDYSVNTASPMNLVEADGTSLSDEFTYTVSAVISGTGTNTGAVAMFISNRAGTNGSGWALKKISEKGTASNHIEFFIDENGKPSVRTYAHATKYTVRVTHEKQYGTLNINDILETRISNAELLITPEAITATVVESEDLTSKLQGYATQEALGNYLSNDDFSTEKENIIGEIDSRIGAIDYSPFVQATELEQKTDALTAKISQAGGVNLIQNSIGWAGKDFWSNFSATAGVSIQNEELASMGFGSGWYSQATGLYTQKQRLTLPRSGTYTLSFWLKKTVGSSWAYVQIQKGDDTTFSNSNAFAYAGYSGARLTDGYELFTTTFEATELDIAVSITINTGVEATITGIMLHEGSEPFKWQPYTSEVYNTNVKMDMNGITVKNNADAGYTLITPDEFSGYAPVDGTVERVFTLNGDTTEVKKLKAEQQFEMAPVTIITIDNSKYSGWAFI